MENTSTRVLKITSFPNEVLSQILVFACPIGQIRHVRLSLVNRTFRGCILDTPVLWSYISSSQRSEFIDLQLNRSRRCGLTIKYDTHQWTNRKCTCKEFLEKIKAHADRWENVELAVNLHVASQNVGSNTRILSGLSTPMLKSLTLCMDEREDRRGVTEVFLTWEMPNLRYYACNDALIETFSKKLLRAPYVPNLRSIQLTYTRISLVTEWKRIIHAFSCAPPEWETNIEELSVVVSYQEKPHSVMTDEQALPCADRRFLALRKFFIKTFPDRSHLVGNIVKYLLDCAPNLHQISVELVQSPTNQINTNELAKGFWDILGLIAIPMNDFMKKWPKCKHVNVTVSRSERPHAEEWQQELEKTLHSGWLNVARDDLGTSENKRALAENKSIPKITFG